MKWIYDNNFQSGQALALDKSDLSKNFGYETE